MVNIKYDDCHIALGLGPSLRRSLRKYMLEWLLTTIGERGFSARDPLLFDQDVIEDYAERLTETLIFSLETLFCDEADMHLANCTSEALADWLRNVVPSEIEVVQQQFLELGEAGGLDFLIGLASGAPIIIDHLPDDTDDV